MLWKNDAVINWNKAIDKLRGRSPLFWAFILIIAILNFWFDYYNPRGALIDVIIVAAVFISYLKFRYRRGRGAKS